MNYYIFTGSIIGFSIWIALLEGPSMGGIIFRKDQFGNIVFAPKNIFSYIKAPFTENYFWTISSFYQHNWIIMTMLGGFIGSLIK
jgi:hypothetical protein